MTETGDEAARHRIRTEFGTTFFVEAAAGTGKTTALVGRIVSMIRWGKVRWRQTVAVTFTEKAAGEMKLRLRLEIEKARTIGRWEERQRLDQALEELELARIGTIHSFCADILRERPVEAGIDPVFQMLLKARLPALCRYRIRPMARTVLADPPEGVRRVMRRARGSTAQAQLREAVQTCAIIATFPPMAP